MQTSHQQFYTAIDILLSIYLFASSDQELLERSDVIDEQVHESELLAEAHQHKEASGMQGNAVGLLLELLVKVQTTAREPEVIQPLRLGTRLRLRHHGENADAEFKKVAQ